MTDAQIHQIKDILRRDLPGWSIVKDSIPVIYNKNSYLVYVEKGSLKRTILITGGRVVGAQG